MRDYRIYIKLFNKTLHGTITIDNPKELSNTVTIKLNTEYEDVTNFKYIEVEVESNGIEYLDIFYRIIRLIYSAFRKKNKDILISNVERVNILSAIKDGRYSLYIEYKT